MPEGDARQHRAAPSATLARTGARGRFHPMTTSPPPLEQTHHDRRLVAALGVALVVLVGVLAVASDDGDPPGRSTTRAARPEMARTTSTVGPAEAPSPTPPPRGTTPDPDALLVLVDHSRSLPEGYVPGDLVLLEVPFTFDAVDPRRFLRQEASTAIDDLFAAAAVDQLPLLGVSGFRSTETQAELFADYAARDGEEAADRYSARPGHSEHQTGLAIDVVGRDGLCPVEACFADRPEAAWLADHAHEFGFIVRYPADGESSTGYRYEPWHLRYVGVETATEIHTSGQTLEQHLGLP